MKRWILLGLGAALMSAAGAGAADWTQWRGPACGGVLAETPALAVPAADEDVKPLWTSEDVAGDSDGGFASPVVAGGKVYQYSCWRTWFPIEHRILTRGASNQLGHRRPEQVSDELSGKIETARTSDEQKELRDKPRDEWVQAWIEANLTDEQKAEKAVRDYAYDRLKRGAQATPLEIFAAIEPILEKRFETQAELDAWLAESGVDPEFWKQRIQGLIPTRDNKLEDVVLCLDAADGHTIWRKAYPTSAGGWASSSTPCVAAGLVCFLGGNGTAYGLDAATGEEKWQRSLVQGGRADGYNSSFVAWNGKLFVLAHRLVALDAGTGDLLWEQAAARGVNSSPVVRTDGGRTLVICGEQGGTIAADAETGEVVWKVDASGSSSPAVDGDLMAIEHNGGMILYRISAAAAEKIAESDKGGSRGGSPVVHAGRVYSGSREAVCLDPAAAEPVWVGPKAFDDFSSPIMGDGRLWCFGRNKYLVALNPADGEETGRLSVDFLRCTSPAIADGRLYVRTRSNVRCYELKAQ